MNDYGMIGMTVKWYESESEWDKWLENDLNESGMMWMTVEWYEWV